MVNNFDKKVFYWVNELFPKVLGQNSTSGWDGHKS